MTPSALRVHTRCGPSLDIAEANDHPLQTLGYLLVVERLSTCMAQLDSFVWDKLAASVIVVCGFFDHVAEAICPCARAMKMDNGSTVPIVRKLLKRATQKQVTIPAAQEKESKDPISTKLRIDE